MAHDIFPGLRIVHGELISMMAGSKHSTESQHQTAQPHMRNEPDWEGADYSHVGWRTFRMNAFDLTCFHYGESSPEAGAIGAAEAHSRQRRDSLFDEVHRIIGN